VGRLYPVGLSPTIAAAGLPRASFRGPRAEQSVLETVQAVLFEWGAH